MTRSFTPPWIALFVAYGLGVTGALGDLPRSPEHEAQLFFADHAWRDWWGRFDARWYGGLDVTTVPLVAAQLVALLAKVPGLGVERAYAVVVGLAGVLTGLGAVRLARALATTPTQGAGWLVVAAAASPLAWLCLIPQGLLPGTLALGFALNAAAWARAEGLPALLWTLVSGAAASAAHPMGLLAVLLTAPALVRSARSLLCVGLGVLVGGLAAEVPLRAAVATWAAAPSNLPEAARTAILLLALVGLVVALRQRAARAAAIELGALALAALASLGTAVVPPSLLLALALTLALAGLASLEGAPGWPTFVAAAVVFALTAATLGWYRNADTRSRRSALRDVEWVLANAPDGERFRFVSLGVGREWLELSRRVRPRAIDGALDWLVPSWDGLRPDDAVARARLAEAVADPARALRWAIVGAQGWDETLSGLGFRNVGAWRGNVTLWQRDQASPMPPTGAPWQRAPWPVVVLGPLVGLLALVAALAGLRELRTGTSPQPTA